MSGPTKLFLPDPEICLYKDGFGQNDILDRAKTGTQMSDLLERISDPLVIALDGKWGTGKTHFLKRWVGAHETNSNYKATTLYFDAFESDFLDDPLIALTAALDNRINTAETSSAFKKMKLHASKLAGPLARIGLSIATYGMTEVANATVDAALTQAEKEGQKALDDFWAREIGKRAAMRGFRDGLKTSQPQRKTTRQTR